MTNRDLQSRSAERTVRDIRRATRRKFSSEEKIRIVLEGLRGEDSIAELCPREGINSNLYYRWSKEFLEAGKKRLAGDTAREATSDEVKDLRAETLALKEAVAEPIRDVARGAITLMLAAGETPVAPLRPQDWVPDVLASLGGIPSDFTASQ